jgi:hypothetical protein
MNIRPLVTTLFASGVALAMAATTLTAQTNYSDQKASGNLTIGAEFQPGISLSVDPPEGSTTGPLFAYRVGAASSYPLSSSVWAMLNLGLDSRGVNFLDANNSDNRTETRVNYFSIFPAFRFSAFILGVNFGLPLGGTVTDVTSSSNHSTTLDASKDNLATMIEPRIGAVLPLIDEKGGWLGLTVMAGYTLNEIKTLTDDEKAAQELAKQLAQSFGADVPSFGKTNMVSFHLGLTYQFAIPGTAR